MDDDSTPESVTDTHPESCPCCRLLGRRAWFRAAFTATAAVAAATTLLPASAQAVGFAERRIRLLNVNTHESFDGVYWRDGRYLPPAMGTLNRLLRDHRADEATRMDPELFDLLNAVAQRFGSDE